MENIGKGYSIQKFTVSRVQLELLKGRLGIPKTSDKLPPVKKLFQKGGKLYKFIKIINFRQGMPPPPRHSALLNACLGLEEHKSSWLPTKQDLNRTEKEGIIKCETLFCYTLMLVATFDLCII